jgi:hypothetical protein
MNGKLTIIPANAGDPICTVHLGRAAVLGELQAAIGGGYIETVPYLTRYEGKSCVAFCDEEGKLKGQPVNDRATALWRFGSIRGSDLLCGDVVVVQGDRDFMKEI